MAAMYASDNNMAIFMYFSALSTRIFLRNSADHKVCSTAFVKRFCKSFCRQNGLQNRFTEDFKSAVYASVEYNENTKNPPPDLSLIKNGQKKFIRSAGLTCTGKATLRSGYMKFPDLTNL